MNERQNAYLNGYDDAMRDAQTILKAAEAAGADDDGAAILAAIRSVQARKLAAMADAKGGDA